MWAVRPDTMLSCGGEVFRAPWRLSAAIVSRESRPLRVWAAFHHHTWWPSFVLEIAPDGTPAMRYVQAGWVRSLAEWPTVAGTMLAAGGVTNEWGRASVAVVDVAGPPALLPTEEPRFRCDVSGTVPPRLVALFPEHKVSRASGHPYVMVQGLVRQGPDLRVEINGVQAIAMLEPDAGVTSLRMGDEYWPAHDALTRAGTLDHLAPDCPERTQPRELRTWTRDGLWGTTRLGQPADPTAAPGR